MSESAGSTSSVLAESASSAAASSGAGEITNRPKVMRRPATFSAPSHQGPLPFEMLKIPPVVEHVATPQYRPWQDDGRFGIALLAIVVIINVLLAVAIPSPHRAPISFAEKATIAHSDNDSFMAAPTTKEHATVTIYAQPSDDRRSTQFFDLRQLPSSQNSLSVSPHDMPAPNAQALDQRVGQQ